MQSITQPFIYHP